MIDDLFHWHFGLTTPIVTSNDTDFLQQLPYLSSRIARRSRELGLIYQLDLDYSHTNHDGHSEILDNPTLSMYILFAWLVRGWAARLYDYEYVGEDRANRMGRDRCTRCWQKSQLTRESRLTYFQHTLCTWICSVFAKTRVRL